MINSQEQHSDPGKADEAENKDQNHTTNQNNPPEAGVGATEENREPDAEDASGEVFLSPPNQPKKNTHVHLWYCKIGFSFLFLELEVYFLVRSLQYWVYIPLTSKLTTCAVSWTTVINLGSVITMFFVTVNKIIAPIIDPSSRGCSPKFSGSNKGHKKHLLFYIYIYLVRW